MSLALPFYFQISIRRLSGANDKAVILEWSLYDNLKLPHFVLLCQIPAGYQKVDVPMLNVVNPNSGGEDTLSVNGYNQELVELLPSSRRDFLMVALTENYQKQCMHGDHYELIWPRDEVSMWDWGTKQEHVGKELKSQD